MLGLMCSTDTFKFRWSKLYICNSLSASNRKYQPFPLLPYFPLLCVWGGCAVSCKLFHISPVITVQSRMCANNRVSNDMKVVFVCFHISLIIKIMQTYLKPLNIYIISRVCLWLSQFNYVSCNIRCCVFSAHTLFLRWLWECMINLIILIESDFWIISICWDIGHEIWSKIFFTSIYRYSFYLAVLELFFDLIHHQPKDGLKQAPPAPSLKPLRVVQSEIA